MKNPLTEAAEKASLNECYKKLLEAEPKFLEAGAWDDFINMIVKKEREDRDLWIIKAEEKGKEE